ncbi:MAG: 8-oxo-dGTP diphosphatase [Lachnospiraceae bacterium]|nr:8-oxo-dGTP diphosphatase [Lachnospiraceae bacterium]
MVTCSLTTLCYLEKDDQYLMMHRVKKVNDINKDKWIGAGGHAEEYESPEDCLLREIKEELGVELTEYHFRGLITFCLLGKETQYMCLYTATAWKGELASDCNEGNLEWISKDKIPNLPLWKGDLVFFELLRKNQPFFSLKLTYDHDDTLISCNLDGKEIMDTYTIEKADYADVEKIYALEQTAYEQMPVKEWYVTDDIPFLERHIDREGFILKAVSAFGELAGFLVVRYPKEASDNLFHDIKEIYNLSDEEMLYTAHMESTAVSVKHRGHHLQEKLVLEGMRLAALDGYRHFCATVHPDNKYSRRSGDAAGFCCVCEKEKYGGLRRCIYYKKLT